MAIRHVDNISDLTRNYFNKVFSHLNGYPKPRPTEYDLRPLNSNYKRKTHPKHQASPTPMLNTSKFLGPDEYQIKIFQNPPQKMQNIIFFSYQMQSVT